MSKHMMPAIVALLALGATVVADDWTFFRGPNQDGVSAETGWNASSKPKELWRRQVGVGSSSVVVKGDRLITMGNQNNNDVIWCLNAETGEPMWNYKYPCKTKIRNFDSGTASTPTIDGEFVYTLSELGHLFCLRISSGKPVWGKLLTKDFGGKLPRWRYAGSPLIDGNYVYVDVGGTQYSTVALNKKSGAPFWGVGRDGASYATPIVLERNGKRSILVFKGKALVAHDAKTGREHWRIPWKTSYDVHASTPIIMGDKMFISSGYSTGGALYDLKSTPPKQLWANKGILTKISSAVAYKGFIYASTDRGTLICIDAKDGKRRWSERGMGGGTLCIADGKLIALSSKGELAIAEASPNSFKPLFRTKILDGTCWVMPVLANGRLYCKNNRGELICFDVSG